jgi:hypothetical protein
MLGQPTYAKALIDCDLNFKDITPHKLDGNVHLRSKNGSFNTKVLQEAFALTIPKTTFELNLDAILKGDKVAYTTAFNSNLVKLQSQGDLVPQPLQVDLSYKANIKELGLLEPLTNAPLRGALNFHGNVKGNKDNANITLFSDVAASNTQLKATLKEFKPATLTASMQNIKLEKLLYMLKQPHYGNGVFNLQADFTNLEPKAMQGKVTLKGKGKLDSHYLSKAYKFKHPMPSTTFTLQSKTNIKDSVALSHVALNSTLAKVDMPDASFDINKNIFTTSYTANIASLDKL